VKCLDIANTFVNRIIGNLSGLGFSFCGLCWGKKFRLLANVNVLLEGVVVIFEHSQLVAGSR
jgi:hypothetical protein